MNTTKLTASELLLILDVTRHLAEQRMVQPLVEYIATKVFEIVPAERCMIVLQGADGAPQIAAARGRSGAPIERPEAQISRSILERARANLSPVLVNDALEDDVLRMSQSVRSLGLRSVMCIPLVARGQAIGAIYVENRQASSQFREDNLIPLILLATQVEIAIENARAYESLESKVAERTRELSAAIEHLRTTQSQLAHSERMAALGNLVAGVAHELRNPLNFVNNLAQLSIGLVADLAAWAARVDPALPPAEREALSELLSYLSRNCQEIYGSGQRADSIISMMLLHTRGDRGQAERADINALVRRALSLTYHSLRARKPDARPIAIEERLQPDLPLAEVVPERLSQALINLFDNAGYALWERQQYEPDFEPRLRVSTAAADRQIEIRIWDNGSGIAPQLHGTLFEPFVTTKLPGEGTGLGLSLTYDIIVNGHAGSIQFDSQPNRFTEFTITLPTRAPSATAHSATASD